MRTIDKTYRDPLEIVWLRAASQLGIEVRRDSTVFATWDGKGHLTIGTPETLDPDDSLAQMIFHEICHWLVEGDEAFSQEDWGLIFDEPEHLVHEYACLRLQAALADGVGLRKFFGSTTDYRAYFDLLTQNPLEENDDPAVALASAGWERARQPRVAAVLDDALKRTREIANVLADIAPATSLWASDR